jgi:hypothetical protein
MLSEEVIATQKSVFMFEINGAERSALDEQLEFKAKQCSGIGFFVSYVLPFIKIIILANITMYRALRLSVPVT